MKPEQLMGLSIIPITLVGSICNWLVVIAIRGNKSLNHSFSLLTATQAAFNGAFCVIYLAYVAPMIILDNTFLMDHSENVGFLMVICYDISIQTHAIITINRFCAVFLPLVYKSIFNTKWTRVIILASVSISLTVIITFFKILPCRAIYGAQNFGFTYTDAPICLAYSYYGDMLKLTSLCIFNVVVDTITIWKVRKVRSAQGMTKFQKKEIDFLKQVALIGTICNGLVVIAISTNRSLNHSFSILTGNQAVFNGLFSMIYLAYVTPMIILDSEFLKSYSQHAGFLLLLFYDISIQTHSLITVNRFCAVFLPMVYEKMFNKRWTNVIMLVSFLISFIQLTIFFQILPCRIYYNEEELGYYYTDLSICSFYSLYLDMGKLMTICTFNVVVDTITIYKVRKIRSAQGITKFQKKEIDFLKQSFGQALYLFICIPAYYIVPIFTSSKIVAFMLGMFFWATIHMFDGVLTLYFNMEIRKSLMKKYKIQSVSGNQSVVLVGGKLSSRVN